MLEPSSAKPSADNIDYKGAHVFFNISLVINDFKLTSWAPFY